MAKAIVDPVELRRFAHDLKRFNGELQTQLTGLQARFTDLSRTWRDQEARKFGEEFETTIKALARFTEASQQHIPFLLRKVERAEDYLRQR